MKAIQAVIFKKKNPESVAVDFEMVANYGLVSHESYPQFEKRVRGTLFHLSDVESLYIIWILSDLTTIKEIVK